MKTICQMVLFETKQWLHEGTSLEASNDKLLTVRALGSWMEVEYIGRFLGTPCIWRLL